MDPKNVEAILEAQRKCYNDSITRLEDRFIKHIKENEQKHQSTISSLQFTQNELDDVKTKLATAIKEDEHKTKKIELLQHSNQDLQQQLQDMANRIDYMDDQSRRNNLRFTGVKEEPGETWEKCQEKLSAILIDKLGMDPSFERVHRIGRLGEKVPRDLVAKFTRFSEREAVMRNRRKMKGTNIFINEDLCPASIAVRMKQMPAYHQARKDGKLAFFNYRTLVVRPHVTSNYQTSTSPRRPHQHQQTPRSPSHQHAQATSTSPPHPPPHQQLPQTPPRNTNTSLHHLASTSPHSSPSRQSSASITDVDAVDENEGDGQRSSARHKKATEFFRAQ